MSDIFDHIRKVLSESYSEQWFHGEDGVEYQEVVFDEDLALQKIKEVLGLTIEPHIRQKLLDLLEEGLADAAVSDALDFDLNFWGQSIEYNHEGKSYRIDPRKVKIRNQKPSGELKGGISPIILI